ncbi:TPA: PspC domain-containing protein [Streptococcus suis]|uniref:PspC domain-containing protein n=1 Tax=Streptococcus suis TaxID=1307 RepID=UPI001C9D3355|nr:PspC domain-containing protein [Streptococcus suis]QZS50911.1 PspC domain-containing protein [Streptococcus suis]HEM3428801.1 PspC domain-containing protein [Streptococcus suis]HEM3451200.1 PspC domain-containing protein [Streptococcus suis]HEM3461757.1 PspC domain-containing protein [Streptococcus suis]HEM3498836.1 PspC domain-containing protein [Streptococcus suis]
MNKKWYKDESRGELAGVIAGLYDYFDLYENYGWKLENVRLVVIILAIVTNLPFLTAYIILAILLPDKSELN